MWSSRVAGTLPATPGMTHQFEAYCQPTYACCRISTSHQQTTATHHNTLPSSSLQANGRTFVYSYAEIHWHHMDHRVVSHHIFTSKCPHIWWTGHHKAERLAQPYWDGSQHWACLTEAKSCSLTHTLFCNLFQVEKGLDDFKNLPHLNFSMWPYTHTHQKGTMKFWHAMNTDLYQKTRGMILTVTLLPCTSLLMVTRTQITLQQRSMKRTPNLIRGHQISQKVWHGTRGYSHSYIPYS